MGDNINSSGDQRQFSAGGSGGNNNAMVSRKKANNGGGNGGDLTASPKYNKSTARGHNKDTQQQKQTRGNNQREQRGGGGGSSARYRNHGHHHSNHTEPADYFDYVGVDEENAEDGSVDVFDSYINKRGSITSAKKTNMSHLLNFHYLDKQRVNVRGNRRSSNSNYYSNPRWSGSANPSYRQSFSKEQFLQANCQFVVHSGLADYSVHFADPDLVIDWSRVEQVRLHSTQPLKCPICLSEPQAGKITRCGHVYCWTCLLHYLALSDKPWRKCPVCSESIYKEDIRSVRGIVSRSLKPGDWITFRLMCRERGSVLFHSRKDSHQVTHAVHEPEGLAIESNKPQYAHLLSASDEVVLTEIIEREKMDLLKQLEDDGDQPEACFVKQALEENNEREKSVRERMGTRHTHEAIKVTPKPAKEEENLLPIKPAVVYDNAFDDIILPVMEENEPIHTEEKPHVQPPTPSETHATPTASALHVQPTQHYFYQADDIYHTYLSGFNTRMLLHEYGSYQQCPDELHVRVEAIESFFMTEDLRSQFRSLNHLPLTCEFQVIEVRLHPPLISPMTLQSFTDEIHRRRQFRTRKERLEKRRQQQAEFVESQKLFSQYPPEMMYIPQERFPVNGTNSMEEFPAMIATASSSPPSASVQLSDENLSPPAGVSFAQMLKQQAPPTPQPTTVNKPTILKSSAIEISTRNKKSKNKKDNNGSDDEPSNEDAEYYASASNFHSSFSLEGVFDRLKLVTGEEHPSSAMGEVTGNAPSKKKNKKTKQVLFATGLGGQAKL